MSKTKTACPLDCYDACEILYVNDKILPYKSGHTQGFLCRHMNHYEKYPSIVSPRYNGVEITMDEALNKLKEILASTQQSEILHYRGHGNFALMQEVTDHFFASFGATLTDGSLCDGAGEAGIMTGRGSNKNMSMDEITKSDVVIFWGRNPHTTSSHLLPLIKDKTIIVIDPIKTQMAKTADLFVQIRPHTDLYLAMLIVRFLHINGECDEEYVDSFAEEFEDYYELTQTIRIKANLDGMDVTLGDIGKIIDIIKGKKVAIVTGVGIQKYSDGADIIRAIDAIAVSLGLFSKEGSGVAYLGNSKAGIDSPFHTKAKRVSKVNTQFDDFKTVFIQGANPLSQMPDSLRVKNAISRCENVIYFGLYENESSKVANLVIPAKSFLHKDDIRTSYSHDKMMIMNKQSDSLYGISEYNLTKYLCAAFDIDLESEKHYLEHFKSFSSQQEDGSLHVNGREEKPYKNGFDTDDGQFLFLEEFEKITIDNTKLHLITPKSSKSLNSQFTTDNYAYIHSSLHYKENSKITLSSKSGTLSIVVKYNDDVRADCILIYSGTIGLNNLTSSKHSIEGKSAIYQEELLEIS